MHERISSDYTQAHLDEFLDRVNQENLDFIIETNGEARAVLISYTKYQLLNKTTTRVEE